MESKKKKEEKAKKKEDPYGINDKVIHGLLRARPAA